MPSCPPPPLLAGLIARPVIDSSRGSLRPFPTRNFLRQQARLPKATNIAIARFCNGKTKDRATGEPIRSINGRVNSSRYGNCNPKQDVNNERIGNNEAKFRRSLLDCKHVGGFEAQAHKGFIIFNDIPLLTQTVPTEMEFALHEASPFSG